MWEALLQKGSHRHIGVTHKVNVCKVFALWSLTLLVGCGPSPKGTLETYLNSGITSKRRYETICEKKFVSLEEFRGYYSSPLRSKNSEWKTTNIREVERTGDNVYIDADHEYQGRRFTRSYLVVNKKGDAPCVSWTAGGRFSVPATRLVRYPREKITIYTKVELSDYYNYDFRGKEQTHMALKITSDDDTWRWNTVYIPYDGNESLYDYLSEQNEGLVKMVVSREYDVSLDTAKVDEYNKLLYNLQSAIDSASSSLGRTSNYEPSYLEYEQSYVTDDESILFAPTAVPILLK